MESSPILQLLLLAGIAVFLILRLKSVLGTRDGFEPPRQAENSKMSLDGPAFEVIDGGPDHDITDHVDQESDAAAALAEMKRVESDFGVNDFLQGAKGAYEMILMAFENGKMEDVQAFLAADVFEAFDGAVKNREQQGLTIEAEFIGVRETALEDARFDSASNTAEITVRFIGELVSVVKDSSGEIVEGKPGQSKRQKDSWTFERVMGTGDPNWRLVATDE